MIYNLFKDTDNSITISMLISKISSIIRTASVSLTQEHNYNKVKLLVLLLLLVLILITLTDYC